MKEFKNQQNSVVVLKLGDELHEQLGNYAREHELASAWVEGIGASGRMTVGVYRMDEQQYKWKEFDEPLEILELKGNLAWVDGEPFWHIHGTFANGGYQAIGGHVKELFVGATCELLITSLETPLTRMFDDETGLKLLTQQ